MKTRWTKADNETLIAEDEETRAWLAKRPQDALIEADTKEPRNPGHHRKFFALVNLVYQNQERFKTQDNLLSALKIAAGHYDTIMVRGVACYVPKSISFAKLDQGQFEEFYDRICDAVLADFWPDMDKATLKAEVAEMCGAGPASEIGRMP